MKSCNVVSVEISASLCPSNIVDVAVILDDEFLLDLRLRALPAQVPAERLPQVGHVPVAAA